MVKGIYSAALVGLVALVVGPLACGGSSGGGGAGAGGDAGSGGTGEAGSGSGGSTGGKGGSSQAGSSGSGGSAGGSGGSTGGSGGSGQAGSAGTAGEGGAGGNGSGGSGGGGKSGMDAGAAGGTSGDAAATGGSGGSAAGGIDITGMFGSQPVQPFMSGFWIGKPGDPNESAGGPFIYLFTGAVTCADISKASGWLPTVPKSSQVLEMIVGTTKEGTTIPIKSSGAGMAEVNYAFPGPPAAEHNSSGGTITITAYKAGMYVEGTIDVMFPLGSAKGKFHADWCPTGREL